MLKKTKIVASKNKLFNILNCPSPEIVSKFVLLQDVRKSQ